MPEQELYLAALGAVIRARRQKLGLTQLELACEVGTTQSRIYEWEYGRRDMRLVASLMRLAKALRMELLALLAAAELEYADRLSHPSAGSDQRAQPSDLAPLRVTVELGLDPLSHSGRTAGRPSARR